MNCAPLNWSFPIDFRRVLVISDVILAYILFILVMPIVPFTQTIHPTSHGLMSPVGVQCSSYLSFSMRLWLEPSFSECIYFLVTPYLYVVQPFSFWSSSFCFPFHIPEHPLFYQSVLNKHHTKP